MAQFTVTRKATFLGKGRVRRAKTSDAKQIANAPPPPRPPLPTSPERLLRNLALAVWIERHIDDGTIANYADAARKLGVSRARVCQLLRIFEVPSDAIQLLGRVD